MYLGDVTASIKINEFGNLEIVLDNDLNSEDVSEAIEYHNTPHQRIDILDLCEKALCNSEYQIASSGSDAPAIGIPVYNDEENEVIDYSELYFYEPYAVADEVMELLTEGKVIFIKAVNF